MLITPAWGMSTNWRTPLSKCHRLQQLPVLPACLFNPVGATPYLFQLHSHSLERNQRKPNTAPTERHGSTSRSTPQASVPPMTATAGTWLSRHCRQAQA